MLGLFVFNFRGLSNFKNAYILRSSDCCFLDFKGDQVTVRKKVFEISTNRTVEVLIVCLDENRLRCRVW